MSPRLVLALLLAGLLSLSACTRPDTGAADVTRYRHSDDGVPTNIDPLQAATVFMPGRERTKTNNIKLVQEMRVAYHEADDGMHRRDLENLEHALLLGKDLIDKGRHLFRGQHRFAHHGDAPFNARLTWHRL